MLKGFRDFILRGNVVELATAVIVGAAFTAIVEAISTKLIQPLLAVAGPPDMEGLGFEIVSGNKATFMDFGAVITAAINFLIVAAIVYFVIIVPMNKLNNLRNTGELEDEDVPPTQEELLAEIRDLLAGRSLAGDATEEGNNVNFDDGSSSSPRH
ncbi:large conductance mechanosensitive channel protein MscL [Brevibacterium ravenspurgense]|uniref:large conductance mechanosensitive channel protein MscL n=1 Tax=Brevibacterium ravenspurgense TaxID=479117 RepID=UPI00030BF6C3|nr:large conductance mechanosensitive channel protein MscL [Brevibacterium ravenspurgense]HJH13045.1 large conductance mechanosensitive channel protein MscL [Brevibacterium ravenspurgense]